MTHDSWLESGKSGPNDDNEPVPCPRCEGRGERIAMNVAFICDVCDGSGLIDKETAEAMQETEEPNGD